MPINFESEERCETASRAANPHVGHDKQNATKLAILVAELRRGNKWTGISDALLKRDGCISERSEQGVFVCQLLTVLCDRSRRALTKALEYIIACKIAGRSSGTRNKEQNLKHLFIVKCWCREIERRAQSVERGS